MAVGCAYGYHVRAVPRAADRAIGHLVNWRAIFVVPQNHIRTAQVTGAAYHNDSGANGLLNSLAERICMERLANWGAKTQIDHANVVTLMILDHPVESGEYVARATNAVFIKYADIN